MHCRVAVVTGGGRGLGFGLAAGLAHYGADVVVAGREPASLDEAAHQVSVASGRCITLPADIREVAQCQAMIERTVAEFGRVDKYLREFHRCARHRTLRAGWADILSERLTKGRHIDGMSSSATLSGVFEQLGATPVINARGNNTVLGGSTPSARVHRAMLDAERYYVDMQQLLERSGAAIAEMLECEAAYVTPGAAAALALGTAACMAGSDPELMAQLPRTDGMKNTVVMQLGHHYHYQRAVTVPGARLLEVDADQFEASLASNVAAVLFPAHLDGAPGTLSLVDVIATAHKHNVPVLVDAAGRIYPIERFKSYTKLGADVVAFGAKYIGALNASGILAGRKDLVDAAALNGFIGFETNAWEKSFGRPLKVDRQTIVAVVTALREWLDTDHEARITGYERRLRAMARELDGAAGVTLDIVTSEGPAPRVLRIAIRPGEARHDAQGVIDALWSGSPAISVGRDGDTAVLVNPVTLREEDDGLVVSRLGTLLL